MEKTKPIPLFLTCPRCSTQHVDVGEFATKPHRDHSCQKCGLTWRPALVPTVGVAFLPGYKNEGLITKPCEDCTTPVEDTNDPNFKDPWLCYWCHCKREGKDPKESLNGLAQLMKAFGRGMQANGGLSHAELLLACNNIGYDLSCGACASVFYTGMGLPGDTHTCRQSMGEKLKELVVVGEARPECSCPIIFVGDNKMGEVSHRPGCAVSTEAPGLRRDARVVSDNVTPDDREATRRFMLYIVRQPVFRTCEQEAASLLLTQLFEEPRSDEATTTCAYCGEVEGHTKRCSVTKFGAPENRVTNEAIPCERPTIGVDTCGRERPCPVHEPAQRVTSDATNRVLFDGMIGTGNVRRTVTLRPPLRGDVVYLPDEKNWAVLTGAIQRTYYEPEPEVRFEAIPIRKEQWLLHSDFTQYAGADPKVDPEIGRTVAEGVAPLNAQRSAEAKGVSCVNGCNRPAAICHDCPVEAQRRERAKPEGGDLLLVGTRLKFPNQWNDGFVWGTVAGSRTRFVNENQIKYDAGHFGSWMEPRFISALETRPPVEDLLKEEE